MELPLKYGCNPNQQPAKLITPEDSPLAVVNGSPSYINLLDALRSWQLVKELAAATGKAAAASFKHVSPAGAAVAGELSEAFVKSQFIDAGLAGDLSPVGTAYAKARSSDRVASFGDFIAVSEVVDESLARLIKPEVSDGIIAPGYDAAAVELLSVKKGGKYVMLQMDAGYEPPTLEQRVEFGLTLEQKSNDCVIDAKLFEDPANIPTANKSLDAATIESGIVATIVLKHTQSNSISVATNGHAIGIGAGQQSRIACTRIACDKADRWSLKMHPKALALCEQFVEGLPRSERVNAVDGLIRWDELSDTERAQLATQVTGEIEPITAAERADWFSQMASLQAGGGKVLSSDAFIPFRDNIDRAASSGCSVIVQTGGSARDDSVVAAADEHGMAMVMTGIRLFLH